MTPSEQEQNRQFEAEARRVGDAVWGLPPGQCRAEAYSGSDPLHELDGIARLRDVTHLLMVTVSRKLEKVKEDVKKLNVAESVEKRRGNPCRKWLITKFQVEAEHLKYAEQNAVTALTLDQFRERFFDGRKYLNLRRAAPFGSARNLTDDTVSIPEDEYVELPIELLQLSGKQIEGTGEFIALPDIAARIRDGQIVVMLAPFGSGKSLTTREIFLRLRAEYFQSKSTAVPVAVNLREHWGQQFGDEILERHGRSLGFAPREDLVIAWRAGVARLLLDGVDEVASPVLAPAERVSFMREARYQALQGVRELLSGLPGGSGALLCGRNHYFDDGQELAHALGLASRQFTIVRLGEFTEEQAARFLRKHRVTSSLPDWLPRKPLILGYLAHRELLEPILQIDGSQGFGHAWDAFLDLICAREATYGRAVMDPVTLRRVLERLACDVRSTSSGTGPITGLELAAAYQREAGQVPSEGVLMQLQRLPGLAAREQDPAARSFIDEDFLGALQGSAVGRFALEGSLAFDQRQWLSGLPTRAAAMAAYLLRKAGASPPTLISRSLQLTRSDAPPVGVQLAADLLVVALELARDVGDLDCHGQQIVGGTFTILDFEDVRVHNLTLEECIIGELSLGATPLGKTVVFKNCFIERIHGVSSAAGLPGEAFRGCHIETYDDLSTNSAIIRSALPANLKALLTVLRKLYLQAGGGRKVAALKRGLPGGPVLDAVDSIVSVLQSEELITITAGIAHPIRRQTARVLRIIAAPERTNDPLVARIRSL